MSVRFVFGRSGSGKTWRSLQAIRAELKRSPFEGNRLILLVPEQASLQAERGLLSQADLAGFTRCEVLSFRRFGHRLLGELGGAGPTVLTPVARQMVIQHLLAGNADRLRFFGGLRQRAGLAEQLARTIGELLEQEVDPGQLGRSAAAAAKADASLEPKLADLALLYGQYLDYLTGGRADPTALLTVARAQLERCGWLRGAQVWVDGFAGLTVQQREFLAALAGVAGDMEIALLMDPGSELIDRPGQVEVDAFSLFARTERTYKQLWSSLKARGVKVSPPVRLTDQAKRRFGKAPVLGRLERSLFAGRQAKEAAGGAAEQILLVEAPNRRCEVAAAVRQVVWLTRLRRPSVRYRDVAIIVRELEGYHDLLRAELASHGVPYFIDRREPIGHHPVVQLVRSALELLDDDFSPRAVGQLLKTGLTPLADEQADQLENYILANGIRGRTAWMADEWQYRGRGVDHERRRQLSDSESASLEQVNHSRRRLMDVLGEWVSLVGLDELPTVKQWAGALFELLERLGAQRLICQWFERDCAQGQLDRAGQHQQVWRDLMGLLDDLVEALGGQPMGLGEFREVVEAGLAGMSLALVPPGLDQVLVGSIERSRHPELKAAVVLGLSERSFPLAGGEDNILTDSDRQVLAGSGVELGATGRQRLLDERLLGYIAMTRPAEFLWLSWPVADEKGRKLLPSPFVGQVRRVLGPLPGRRLADPAVRPEVAAVSTPVNLAGYLATVLRQRRAGGMDAERIDPWLALYEWAIKSDRMRPVLRRVLGSLVYRIDAGLDKQAVGLLGGGGETLVTSVSRLERYAACPFAHFAGDVLGLRERELFELAAVDLGRLYHAILERFTRQLIEAGLTLGEMDDEAIGRALGQISAEAVGELHDELMLAEPAMRFRLDRSDRQMSTAVHAQRFLARGSKFLPVGTELVFDDRRGADLPSLEVVTPAGRRVRLRGRIDRVDLARIGERVAAIVLDYKSGRAKRLALEEVFHGLSLQLMAYLLVLGQHGRRLAGGPVTLAGAFYAPLLGEYEKVDDPSQGRDDESARAKAFRFRGVFDISYLKDLDGELTKGWSQRVSAFMTDKGQAGHVDKTDVADAGQLSELLGHVRGQIGLLADRMVEGQIGVSPVRLGNWMPCQYCPYGSVCRFEPAVGSPRELSKLRRSEVFARLAEGCGGARDG